MFPDRQTITAATEFPPPYVFAHGTVIFMYIDLFERSRCRRCAVPSRVRQLFQWLFSGLYDRFSLPRARVMRITSLPIEI